MIQTGDSIQPQDNQKILLQGNPKDAGKTTFAYSAAVNHGPVLGLQYDLGNPSVPPGVDPQLIHVKIYEPADPEFPVSVDPKTKEVLGLNLTTDRWKPARNLGESMLRDIIEVRSAFREQRPIVLDGVEIPLPKTLVLDGVVALVQGVTDWILSVNNRVEAEDFENRFTLWTKRLSKLGNIFNMLIPLPCNVILITWSAPEMAESKPTGRFLPDIGGKLDIQGAGKFDSSLRCYSEKTAQGARYKVSYRGGNLYPGLGIRGRYDTGADIDVTIELDGQGKPKGPLPYDRVFPVRG